MTNKTIQLTTPLSENDIKTLKTGDIVELTGTIYTARDQAHQKLFNSLKKNEPLPIPKNAILYYAGPTPAKPNEVIGSCGPTTASRMDPFTPYLIENGLTICIGKGARNKEVIDQIRTHNGLYFSALGGCGALHHQEIKAAKCIAYPELLSEAIYELQIEKFTLIVAVDSTGKSIF
jgi:fumarate hydratase subunit beta